MVHWWNDIQKKTEVHTQRPVLVPLCPPQIPRPASTSAVIVTCGKTPEPWHGRAVDPSDLYTHGTIKQRLHTNWKNVLLATEMNLSSQNM
jgi:hypothetical protein